MKNTCCLVVLLVPALTGAAGAADHCGGMAAVPAGDFVMGSVTGGADERPRRTVHLDNFLMDKCEVTASDLAAFMKAAGHKPAKQPDWSCPASPAVAVDWFEADAYCRHAGKRLPTEAEWEKAARGGLDGEYGFSGGPENLDDYAWYMDNSGRRAHPAGEKKPNAYGLYDMHGNAAEWTADWYAPYGPAAAARAGPQTGTQRVIRGGAWNWYAFYFALNLRVSERSRAYPARRSSSVGFRCAKTAGR